MKRVRTESLEEEEEEEEEGLEVIEKEETYCSLYDSQGVPHCIEFNGKELKRIFRNNEPIMYDAFNKYAKVKYPQTPLALDIPEEGSVLINDDLYSLIVFQANGSLFICIYNYDNTARFFDRNARVGSTAWCNNYFMFRVSDEVDNDIGVNQYDINRIHPLALLFENGEYSNVLRIADKATIFNWPQKGVNCLYSYTSSQYDPIIVHPGFRADQFGLQNRHYPACGSLCFVGYDPCFVMHFDMRRIDYIQFMRDSISVLLLMKEILSSSLLHDDWRNIYNLTRNISNDIWRIKKKIDVADLILKGVTQVRNVRVHYVGL